MSIRSENKLVLSEVEQNAIVVSTPTKQLTSVKRSKDEDEDLKLAKLLQAQELAYSSFQPAALEAEEAEDDWNGLSDDEIAARLQAQEDEWAAPPFDEEADEHAFDDSILEAEADESYEQLTALGEMAGKVSKGASTNQLATIQRSVVTSSCQESCCSICRDDFLPNEEISTLPCKHSYHKSCIMEWLRDQKTCCLCGQELPESLHKNE
jgi:hypothetical protein